MMVYSNQLFSATFFLILCVASDFLRTSHSFSIGVPLAATTSHPDIRLHRLRQTRVSPTSSPSLSFSFSNKSIRLTCDTKLWNSPIEDASTAAASSADKTQKKSSNDKSTTANRRSRDLHPITLNALSEALLVRAQNIPKMPLRFIENGSMEPWEVMLTAGTIGQRTVEEEWPKNESEEDDETNEDSNMQMITEEEEEEQKQVVAGRITAVIARLEELEEELLKRCCTISTQKELLNEDETTQQQQQDLLFNLGVPPEELKAWQQPKSSTREKEAAAVIDATCLFDAQLRYNRARSLLAMFLHELEGPGLRKNNVVLPCMDVDFLSEEEFDMLLVSSKIENGSAEDGLPKNEVDKSLEVEDEDEKEARPSLHPITIDAIEEALRLRAQNMTTSPLRIINAQTEWFEVQYSAVKFSDRFMEKFQSKSSKAAETGDFQWTEEELQTMGGRIVGVLMRLDDLEWEWNHRVRTSPLGQLDSPSMIPYEQWKTTLGLHPDNVEQVCFRTVDMAILEEKEFARARAERMVALFLLNIEGPAIKASGNKFPGGSEVDFIDDLRQLELMMPKLK